MSSTSVNFLIINHHAAQSMMGNGVQLLKCIFIEMSQIFVFSVLKASDKSVLYGSSLTTKLLRAQNKLRIINNNDSVRQRVAADTTTRQHDNTTTRQHVTRQTLQTADFLSDLVKKYEDMFIIMNIIITQNQHFL